MTQDKVVIQNQIRALRFAADEMTQQALANRIGVSRQTVNAIEGAKYFPSLEVAFRIARAFGKPLDAVFRCEWQQEQNRKSGDHREQKSESS